MNANNPNPNNADNGNIYADTTIEERVVLNGFKYEVLKSFIEAHKEIPSDFRLFRCAYPEYEEARAQDTHYYALLRFVERSEPSIIERIFAVLLTFKCVMDDIGNDYKRLTEFAVAVGRRMWELYDMDKESILARKYDRIFKTIRNRALSMFGDDEEKIGHFHWVLD